MAPESTEPFDEPGRQPSAARMLAVFDLDGTLLQTAEVDEACYAEAIADVLGIRGISTDWGGYSHSTDRAILGDLVHERLGREVAEADVVAVRRRFVELLGLAARRTPERFRATAGAAEALRACRDAGWRLALATGGWRASALFKIRASGLSLEGMPAAFADDHLERERIILTAAHRALADDGRERDVARPGGETGDHGGPGRGPVRAVYVGDGRWDLRAAHRIGVGFVGVAGGHRAAALRGAGAAAVLTDFSDANAFLRAAWYSARELPPVADRPPAGDR